MTDGMNKSFMTNFSDLERKILATLEEAGEDDIAALANTVSERQGSPAEIKTYSEALKNLAGRYLLELAQVRASQSLRWIPLPKLQAAAILADLGVRLIWSAGERLWKWQPDLRTEVLRQYDPLPMPMR